MSHAVQNNASRRQLALITVAAPAAAWALEQAARQAAARNQTSLASRLLRQGADVVQRFGRGPLADRLGRRPSTTVTREDRNRDKLITMVASRRP